MNAKPIEVIRPANTLRAKLGGHFNIDPDAIKRAEAALQGLSGQFAEWMQDELTRLDGARAAIAAQGMTVDTANALYTRGHDMKGLGATYGFPLVGRMAGSLCRLLEEPETRVQAPLFLIDSHILAIKAAVRDEIRDSDHPVGRTLVAELESRVEEYLKSA